MGLLKITCNKKSQNIKFNFAGKKDYILNGIQDWLYANTPELNGDTIAFSKNGSYLSFLSFNITNVEKYE